MKILILLVLIAVGAPLKAAPPIDLTPKKTIIIDRDGPPPTPRFFTWPMLIAYLRVLR